MLASFLAGHGGMLGNSLFALSHAMSIVALHSYLVYPGKGDKDKPKIGGTAISQSGGLFDMLKGVYEKSDSECNIDISFNHDGDGNQKNSCRDMLVDYLTKPGLPLGRKLAEKLQDVTTGRSRLGLLFLMAGKVGNNHKLVVSRFPADSGILAEQTQEELTVEFIEKIFMKSATSYKAALYVGSSLKTGFWDGKAVDKQINHGMTELSEYWIKDFLESDFKTTAAAGTKRLALALRAAIRNANTLSIKEELVAVARLAPNQKNKRVSISSLAKKFDLTPEAVAALQAELPGTRTYTEQFTLSEKEFDKHIAFESAELENGAILMAPAGDFEDVFTETPIGGDGVVRFSTESKLVDRRLKKTKI
jgi:hypothetical protein